MVEFFSFFFGRQVVYSHNDDLPTSESGTILRETVSTRVSSSSSTTAAATRGGHRLNYASSSRERGPGRERSKGTERTEFAGEEGDRGFCSRRVGRPTAESSASSTTVSRKPLPTETRRGLETRRRPPLAGAAEERNAPTARSSRPTRRREAVLLRPKVLLRCLSLPWPRPRPSSRTSQVIRERPVELEDRNWSLRITVALRRRLAAAVFFVCSLVGEFPR